MNNRGELHGLTRVRSITVDDAHLFVTPEQLDEEFQNVVHLIQFVFRTLDMARFPRPYRHPGSAKREIRRHG